MNGRAAAAGALIGALAGGVGLPRLAAPQPLEAPWSVRRGADADTDRLELGRGSQLWDRALQVGGQGFGAQDQVLLDRAAVRFRAEPLSGAIEVVLRGPARLALDRAGWSVDGQVVASADTPIERSRGGVRVGEVELEMRSPAFEFRAVDGVARLGEVRVEDAAGGALVAADHGAVRATDLALGLIAGAAAGAALGWFGLLPALLLLATPGGAWVTLVERLALVGTPAWVLARGVVLLAFLPGVLSGLRGAAWLAPRPGGGRAWWLASALAAASVVWLGPWLAFAGLALVLLNGVTAQRAGTSSRASVAQQAPMLGAVLAGWPLLGLLWSVVVLAVQARHLASTAPRAAADHLVGLLLLAPCLAEAQLRASYLDEVWAPEALALELSTLEPWWSDRCGEGEPLRVAWVGGSSTAGAWQLAEEPESFFPARAHEALCVDGAVQSWNLGREGADTHAIARALPAWLQAKPADVVVVYAGVNDLWTANHPLTRAEREARTGSVTGRLAHAGGQVRLVRGLGLLAGVVARPASLLGPGALRSQERVEGYPSAVPLDDARRNLETMAGSVVGSGGVLLVVPELVAEQHAALFAPYAAMMTELASSRVGVHAVSLEEGFTGGERRRALLDMNHLSRSGHRVVGQHLADAINALTRPAASREEGAP